MFWTRNKNKGSPKRLPFLLLALWALPVVADGQENAPPPAFEMTRDYAGRPLVVVRLQGTHSYRFLLDTGAAKTMLYRPAVVDMGLVSIPMKSVRVQTATGTRAMQLYALSHIEALGRSYRPGEMVVIPDIDHPGIYGLLGVDLMRGSVMEFRGERVIMHPRGTGFGAADWDETAGRPVARGSLAVDVMIDGLRLPALIDTGANAHVINRPAAAALAQLLGRELDFRPGTISASGGTLPAGSFVAGSLTIGTTPFTDVEIRVVDLPLFAALGARTVPAMVIGAELLHGQPTVIDLADWRLLLRKPAGQTGD